ncbi:MAG: alpha/beta fold hydrolase [Nitrososphaerales archaeon]
MEEIFKKVGDYKIRYFESKVKDREKNLLFIHGLGSSSERWLDIPEALSRYFHTIAVDLIGFGGSDKPQNINYSIETFKKFIIDFISTVGLDDKKICLIGHSLGGYIALETALSLADNRNKKKLIEKLVLIDSSGLLKAPTSLLEEYLDAAMNPTHKKVRCVFEKLAAHPWRLLPVIVDIFINRINVPGAKHAFESAYRNSTSTRIELSRFKIIQDIPTLIIWGSDDKLIPLQHSEIFKTCFNKAQLEIIQDTGHAPYAEKPAIVCELLHMFMADDIK